jgi:radical SAM protein with 4Fe4S-binding SPASM domain
MYVVKNRSSGYVDQSIKSAPVQMGEINQKLYEISDAVKDKQLVSATFNPQDTQCKRCAFVHLCITAPEADSIRDAELDIAVHDWRRGKKLADEGEALMNDAKITLGSFAKSLDTRKFVHDQLAVQMFTQHRVSYDKKVLEENIPAQMLSIAKKEQDIEQLRVNDLRSSNEDLS